MISLKKKDIFVINYSHFFQIQKYKPYILYRIHVTYRIEGLSNNDAHERKHCDSKNFNLYLMFESDVFKCKRHMSLYIKYYICI